MVMHPGIGELSPADLCEQGALDSEEVLGEVVWLGGFNLEELGRTVNMNLGGG